MTPVLIHCSRNRVGMGNLVVLLLAEHAPSEGWRGSGQVPFLLAERAR